MHGWIHASFSSRGKIIMAKKSKTNKVLAAVGVTAAAGCAAYGGVSYYIFREAFDLQNSSLYSGKGGTAYLTFTDEEKSQWFHHSVRDDEYTDSYDGLKLHALRITNHEDHKWVVLLLGPGSYRYNLMDYLYELDHAGYNVLAVDSRGCGKSAGRYTTLGWSEHYDLIGWINYLVNIDPEAQIALLGVSVGAVAVLNAIGDYVPRNVKCACAEGGFSDVRELMLNVIRDKMKVDGALILPGTDLIARQVLHFSLNDISIRRQLNQASVPALFIQGEETSLVPDYMFMDNFNACASEKEMLTRDELLTSDYWTEVLNYLNKYLG